MLTLPGPGGNAAPSPRQQYAGQVGTGPWDADHRVSKLDVRNLAAVALAGNTRNESPRSAAAAAARQSKEAPKSPPASDKGSARKLSGAAPRKSPAVEGSAQV